MDLQFNMPPLPRSPEPVLDSRQSEPFIFWRYPMKKIRSVITLLTLSLLSVSAALAQENPSGLRIFSKDATGWISRTALTLTLSGNTSYDQTGEAFPAGSQLIATDLVFHTDANNLGLVSGSVQIKSPDGQDLQTLTLRGTFGLNVRRVTDKHSRFEHIEAMLEPVPTFAPVNAPQIALAHLSADIVPEAAGPLPFYRAKLDGVVSLPQPMNTNVTINPDKTKYGLEDTVTVVISNNTDQVITTYDLQSYCSIYRLQRQDGDQWEAVGECLMKRRSFPVHIEAGETKRFVLPEESTNPRDIRKPGVYRLVLGYLVGKDEKGETQQIFSPTFQIN